MASAVLLMGVTALLLSAGRPGDSPTAAPDPTAHNNGADRQAGGARPQGGDAPSRAAPSIVAPPEKRRAPLPPATKPPPSAPAEPAATSAPAPSAVPVPPPASATSDTAKPPAGAGIEGSYAVMGRAAEVNVSRLLGDIYHLVSSEGWEGVGILERGVYRGVFRRSGARDAPGSNMGEHRIDWTIPENPVVQVTDPEHGQLAQRWHRFHGSEKRPSEKPLPSTTSPREGAATPGRRPAFGEHVRVDELPEALTKVMPNYPEDAKARRIEGTVTLQVLVLEDGTVGECRVTGSVPGLDQASIEAVRQWRFKPAMAKGVPVAVWLPVPIRFTLR